MSYIIFNDNLYNTEGCLYKIAENISDLNNLNINKDVYKIIEISNLDFNYVKLETKIPILYNENNIITYLDNNSDTVFFKNENELNIYIKQFIDNIENFIKNNPLHPSLSEWSLYKNQLLQTKTDTISYPLTKSLQQFYKDQNLPYLHPLQLP